LRIHGIPVSWTTEITEWNPPFSFVDIQLVGPYKSWHHRHNFERNGATIHGTVDYILPFGPLGNLVHWVLVSRDVKQIFDYRQQKIAALFAG
jgi:ligand-binding SRPBCC domain-containing protein